MQLQFTNTFSVVSYANVYRDSLGIYFWRWEAPLDYHQLLRLSLMWGVIIVSWLKTFVFKTVCVSRIFHKFIKGFYQFNAVLLFHINC